MVIAAFVCFVLLLGWHMSWEHPPQYENQNSFAQKVNKESPKIGPDERIADYTGWLAALTGALVCASLVQGYFLLRSDTTARMTAKAAAKSADVAEAALTVAERPYLVPKEPKMKLWRYGPPGMPPSSPPEYVGTVEYGLFNMGRTVAFLKEVTVRLIFVEVLPENPDYHAGPTSPNDANPRILVGHYPIGTAAPYDCPIYGIGLKQKINAATFNDIQSGKLKPFLFGYIRYADVFEYLHTEGFCFRYTQIGIDQAASQCAIVAGKNYNYSRREKIPPEGFEAISPQGAELTYDDIERLSAQMHAEEIKAI
jgi:hypothetical protein